MACMLLGCLLKNTSLLNNPSYPLTKEDFAPCKFHQIIFVAINRLASDGGNDLTELEIDECIKVKKSAYNIFIENNGLEFISTIRELAVLDNVGVYYNKVRKFSLLRELKENGFDISVYYDEADNSQDHLDEYSIQDIINKIDAQTSKLRSKYDVKYVRTEMIAGTDTAELIAEFEEEPSFGAFLVSPYITQLFMGWNKGHLLMNSSPSGCGKALPNSSIIPTPNGNKRVDEIKVGDYVYDRMGYPTKVLGVYPQGSKEVWQITLKDGRTAKCCDEHLWNVYDRKQYSIQRKNMLTKTLKDIVKTNQLWRYHLPMNNAVEKKDKIYHIPPYVMGVMLGDASFRISKSNHSLALSSEDDELPNVIANTMNWTTKKNSGHNYNWSFYKVDKKPVHVEDILVDYPDLINVYSGGKYIPKEYLNGSITQRWDMLNGLLDTDGSVDSKGRVTFSTTSPHLAEDIVELCNSLGIIATKKTEKRNNYKSGVGYNINIRPKFNDKFKLFHYSKKHNKLMTYMNKEQRHNQNDSILITDIKDLGYTEEMTCFYVDNLEHLFLTENYIVTHNTRLAVANLCGTSIDTLWSDEAQDFIPNPNYQGNGLFIHTELKTRREINPMFLACISNIDVKKLTGGRLSKEEKNRMLKAGEILERNELMISDMPDFNAQKIERKIKERIEQAGLQYCVFDYAQLNSSLGAEYKLYNDINAREDLVLKFLITELKQMAESYNVGIYTMSQLNGNEKVMDFPDESCLSGAKSMKVKLDAGCITLPVKSRPKLYKAVEPFIKRKGFGSDRTPQPNLISFVYKSRFGEYADQNLAVWRYFDRATMRNIDMLVTDQYNQPVNIPIPVIQQDF